MIKKSVLAALLLILMSETLWAKDILITNDAGTQGKGNLLVEVNYEYGSDKADIAGQSTMRKETALGAIFSYGLTKSVDFIFTLPYASNKMEEGGVVTENVNGISDMAAEIKWRFFEADALSFAVKPGISLPAGDEKKGLGTGKAGYNVFFIASKEMQPLMVNLNLAYVRNENDARERKDLWYASLSAEYAMRENSTLVANVGIERNAEKGEDSHPAFFLAGINHSLTENFDINIGIKTGLNDVETDRTFLAGMAVAF